MNEHQVVTEDDSFTSFKIVFRWRDPADAGRAASLLATVAGVMDVREEPVQGQPDWPSAPAASVSPVAVSPSTSAATSLAPVWTPAPETADPEPEAESQAPREPEGPRKSRFPARAVALGAAMIGLAGIGYVSFPGGKGNPVQAAPELQPAAKNPAPEPEPAPVPLQPIQPATAAPAPVPAPLNPPREAPTTAAKPQPHASATKPASPPVQPAVQAVARPAPFVAPSPAGSRLPEAPVIAAPPAVQAGATPPPPAARFPVVEPRPAEAPPVPPSRPVQTPSGPPPVAPAPQPSATQAQTQPAASGGPTPTRRVEPSLPAGLKKSLRGDVSVSVKVYVGANGEVIATVPMKQGDPAVDQAGAIAAEAVKKWHFQPATQNGQPAASQTIVRFQFSK